MIEAIPSRQFMHLVFNRTPDESYCRRLRSLLLCLCVTSFEHQLTPLCVGSSKACGYVAEGGGAPSSGADTLYQFCVAHLAGSLQIQVTNVQPSGCGECVCVWLW